MMFEESHYGKVISKKLSEVLKRNTNKYDQANVATQTGVSPSTIRDVVFQANTLTRNSAPAIVALARIAFKNAQDTSRYAEDDLDFILDELGETENCVKNKLEEFSEIS